MPGKAVTLLNSKGQVSRVGLLQAGRILTGLNQSGGPGWSSGSAQGVVPNADVREECWMIVVDNDGQGGHSWDEAQMAQLDRPPRATTLLGGRRGLIPTLTSSGEMQGVYDQTAWSYNGNNYEPGKVLKIERVAFSTWAILEGGAVDGDTSGGKPFALDCGDGKIRYFELGPDDVLRPVPENPDPKSPQECYEECIQQPGSTKQGCIDKCGYTPPDLFGPPEPTDGGDGGGTGGGGGFGGGGFGGGGGGP